MNQIGYRTGLAEGEARRSSQDVIHHNQLGWQPMRNNPNQKLDDENGNKTITKSNIFRTGRFWVWDPLNQAKVDKLLKERTVQRENTTKLGVTIPTQGHSGDNVLFVRTESDQLETIERKDDFFKGVIVLGPGGTTRFLLETKPSDQPVGTLRNNANVLGKPTEPGYSISPLSSLFIQPVSPVELKSPPINYKDFKSSGRKEKEVVIPDFEVATTTRLNLVKGSLCR